MRSNLVSMMSFPCAMVFTHSEDKADVEWRAFEVYEKVLKVVVRVTNRVFVGLPLCRDSSGSD